MNEVLEWTTLTNDLEMGNADDEVAALPEVVETRLIVLQKTNVKMLKSIALRFSVSPNGNKRALFDCIRDSLHATKVSADEFQYRHSTAAGERVPTWINLNGEEVPAVAGIDMNTGSEKGLFGPMNKENATGGKRTNFSTAAPVERPQFGPKKLTNITKHCQYCYYQLMNEIEDLVRRHFVNDLKQNRKQIQRC